MPESIKALLQDTYDGNAKPLSVRIETYDGVIAIRPDGHGVSAYVDGAGYPIIVALVKGRVNAFLFDDINDDEPKVIDMDGAREDLRRD